ncbi:MAG: winged helix-turn-helix transcriptional regulator [Candidatus Omnitrophica bacterium]|nr:winged helix-turn-helix transcriptional regulator [Candidatus Omnitrophota bacterium]
MRIKKARQILRSFADDTRLRIINLLSKQELNVTELHKILGSSQSNISKHLARLRLTGVVGDFRKGFNVYYHIYEPENRAHKKLITAIIAGLSELKIFKKDIVKLNVIKKLEKARIKGKKRKENEYV